MNEFKVMSNEWFDTMYIENNKIYRNTNKDFGTFELNQDKLIINWSIWGSETFMKNKDDVFYKENINIFKIKLESSTFNEEALLYINNNNIHLTFSGHIGTYIFNHNKLYILWNHKSKEEVFYMYNYGTHFSSLRKSSSKCLDKKLIKNIAIVFPQFHEIEENNKFWGEGFTEWTLLKKIPEKIEEQIIKKPHDDIGYYNLKTIEHRTYMEKLANFFNIHGFCFYHYWFKNKKIMYEPTELMLKDGKPDKPFMFCWANEQWTKKWDGGNNEILIEQDYSDTKGNYDHFIYLLQFFNYKNYIKINNKPVFIFYRLEDKDKNHIEQIIKEWNQLAIENNFSGIYFMRFLGPFDNELIIEGIEGFINFEPGYISQINGNDILSYEENSSIFDDNKYNETDYLNKNPDIENLINKKILQNGYQHYKNLNDKEKKIRTTKFNVNDGKIALEKIGNQEIKFKNQNLGLFVGWNNIPRRNYTNKKYTNYPMYYKNINDELFGETYKKILDKSSINPNNENDFIFITSWNEWNEQSSLEPNNIDGYNYLYQIKNKYQDLYEVNKTKKVLIFSHKGGGTEKYINDLIEIFNDYEFTYFNDYDKQIDYNEYYSKIDMIHINSFFNTKYSFDYVKFFSMYFLKTKKIITIHDYQWLFPNDPNILSYKVNKNNIEEINISNFFILLKLMDIIIFPSHNIYKNYNELMNINSFQDKIKIIQHNDKILFHSNIKIYPVKKYIHVAFVGNFIEYKGSNIYKQLFNNIKYYQGYLIKYHVFGYMSNNEIDNKIDDENFIYHNDYNDNDIIDLLEQNNIHLITHLSLFEESYCYALTNSINSGIPIIYIDHGAFTERLLKNDRYFPTNVDNFFNNFKKSLNYIINNQNTNIIKNKVNNKIQPNRWYLENY